MQADTFIKQVQESFPCQRPDPSRLFEGVRTESGCETLEYFVHVEWPDLTLEMLDGAAGEFWQMSSVWVKYFLPAFMCLTAKYDLEFETYHLETGTFFEVKEEQEALITCVFGYWHSLEWFMTEEWDITTNIFHGLTSKQIELVSIWLKHIDFKALDAADELHEGFDYSADALNAFVNKMNEYSL